MTEMRSIGSMCLLGLLASCDSGATDPHRVLCDGSDGVRLAFQITDPGSLFETGSGVLYDNGAAFLFVDGHCRFHAHETQDLFSDVKTGTLDETEARALADEIDYDAWPRLSAEPYLGVIIHGATLVVHDGVDLVYCTGGCEGAIPDEVLDLMRRATGWTDRLWAEGEALEGSMRVSLHTIPVGHLPEPLATWPLSIPIEEVAFADGDPGDLDLGQARLVSTDDGAGLLRAISRSYRNGNIFWEGFVPFADPAGQIAGYHGFMRDALPMEGDNGIVPFPPRPAP